MPTRLGRHGVAIVNDPEHRWRVDLTAARHKLSDEPIMEGCPCPACSGGHSRGYLRYLVKNKELTGARLLTAAQPRLHRAADGRPARGDRGRHARRARRGAARGAAPLGASGANSPRLRRRSDAASTVPRLAPGRPASRVAGRVLLVEEEELGPGSRGTPPATRTRRRRCRGARTRPATARRRCRRPRRTAGAPPARSPPLPSASIIS